MSICRVSCFSGKQRLVSQKISFPSGSRINRCRQKQTTQAVGNLVAGIAIGTALALSPMNVANVTIPTAQSIYQIAQEDPETEISEIEEEIPAVEDSEVEAAIEKEVEQIETEITALDEETEKGVDEAEIQEEAAGIQAQIDALKGILGFQ